MFLKKIIILNLSLFLFSCSHISSMRSPAGDKETPSVITNTEIRSKDSANLDTPEPVGEFSETQRIYLHPDVQNKTVLWHNIAGSTADWCRADDGKVIYRMNGNNIEVQICENIGTELPRIRDYISHHRKDIKQIKKIPTKFDKLTSMTAGNGKFGDVDCVLDTNTFQGFSHSYSCAIAPVHERARSWILGEGRFKDEPLMVLTFIIDYSLQGSRHITIGDSLMDSVLTLDYAEFQTRRSYNFYQLSYQVGSDK